MLLTEHRRCQDKIIGYCNKLIYQGVLKVRTEPKLSRADRMLDSVGDMPGFYLPELGYAHVAGFSSRRGKSRVNASQSIAMTDWVARIAPLLEKKYKSSIESILARHHHPLQCAASANRERFGSGLFSIFNLFAR
jgi:hypothetical protein